MLYPTELRGLVRKIWVFILGLAVNSNLNSLWSTDFFNTLLTFAGALSLDTRQIFRKIKVPLIYALLQVPGYFFLGIILGFAFERSWISGFTAWAVILAWAVKDVLLYPLYRNALNPGSQNIIARLYGSTALVRVALDPVGQVTLRGEIWQARSRDEDVIKPGTKVVVEGNKGLTLEVTRKEE